MNKYLKYLGYVTLVAIILTTGIFIGMKVEEYNQEQIDGSLSNSTKVALVNLDNGVNYQGKQRNFANELLGSDVEKYIFTGIEDAKSGIENGRYSAYVIIPSDFSYNVSTINTKPVKSLLKYEISGCLTNTASDKAWQNIMMLKEKLNDDVGYMYISSILSEFHEGQENALKVLANDSKDKENIMAISNIDLISTLDMQEVKQLENDIEDLDISDDIEENKRIIESIDIAYKSYMNETSSELDGLKVISNDINSNNQVLENAVNQIKDIENKDGSNNYLTQNITDYVLGYNNNITSNVTAINNYLNYNNGLQGSNNDNYINNKINGLDVLLSSYSSVAYNNLYKISNKLNSTVASIQVVDDKMFEELDVVLNELSDKKIVNDACSYIDKIVMQGFSNYDYNQINTDYKSIVLSIEAKNQSDIKLKESLGIYAVSLGKSDDEALQYTLSQYLEDRKNNTNVESNNFKDDIKIAVVNDTQKIVQNTVNDVSGTLNKYITDLSQSNLYENLNDNIQQYKDSFKDIPNINMNYLIELSNKFVTLDTEVLATKIDEDLKPLGLEQSKHKEYLSKVVEQHKSDNAIFHDKLIAYNPILAIDEDEIERYVYDYQHNNVMTKYKIEDKNREYYSFVLDVYNDADNQVRSLKNDVLKYQRLSDEKIIKGLDNAKQVKGETSKSNVALMSAYISKLPYSKNGTVGNAAVYDFVTAPTELEGNKADNNSITSELVIMEFVLIVTIVLVLLWIILSIILKKINPVKINRQSNVINV